MSWSTTYLSISTDEIGIPMGTNGAPLLTDLFL